MRNIKKNYFTRKPMLSSLLICMSMQMPIAANATIGTSFAVINQQTGANEGGLVADISAACPTFNWHSWATGDCSSPWVASTDLDPWWRSLSDTTEEFLTIQIAETGNVSTLGSDPGSWQTVYLSEGYIDPVIVFSPVASNTLEAKNAMVRLRNVSHNSFEWMITGWNDENDLYTNNAGLSNVAAHYMVMEAGTWLIDGRKVMAGKTYATNTAWEEDVSYSPSDKYPINFSSAPQVFHQVMSTDTPQLAHNSRIRNTSATGFDIKIQGHESSLWSMGETVGFIAFETPLNPESKITYKTNKQKTNSADYYFGSIKSVDHNPTGHVSKFSGYSYNNYGFLATFAATQTTNGGDPGLITLDLSYITADQSETFHHFDAVFQEETSRDAETWHAKEDVSLLAIDSDARMYGSFPGGYSFSAGELELRDGDILMFGDRMLSMQGTTIEVTNTYHNAGLWMKDYAAADRMTFQSDGNFVIYNAAGNPLWATNTVGADTLAFHTNGNIVIYKNGVVWWSTGTADYDTGGNNIDADFVGLDFNDQIYLEELDGPTIKLDGGLSQVSIAGEHTWGVNSTDTIYARVNNGWTHIPGSLKHISVNSSGRVWGVNAIDDIFTRGSVNGGWQQIPGKLKQISVASNGRVWGTNATNNVFTRSGVTANWVHIWGQLKQVSAQTTDGGKVIWGIDLSGNVVYRGSHVNNGESHIDIGGTVRDLSWWTATDGDFEQLSVGSDGYVYAVNATGHVYRRNGIDGEWAYVSQGMSYIDVN